MIVMGIQKLDPVFSVPRFFLNFECALIGL
jgi:hypothetical protein